MTGSSPHERQARGPVLLRHAAVASLVLTLLAPVVAAQSSPPPPPSATMARAMKTYQQQDYYATTIALKQVLDGKTVDSEANRQRAEFFLGKAFYKLKLYALALSYFDRIATNGVKHRYHKVTLKWLVALSRVLPNASGILRPIGKYGTAALSEPLNASIRVELAYLLARDAYRRGELNDAVDLFRRVGRKSSFFLRAKFLEAVTNVRRYDGPRAVAAFKELLVIGRDKPADYPRAEIVRFEELARLQLARLFHGGRQYHLAVKYYRTVRQSSPEWSDSVMETAWAYLMSGREDESLAAAQLLRAPFLDSGKAPEAALLVAGLYFQKCFHARVLASAASFSTKYRAIRKQLKKVTGQHEDNTDLYTYVTGLGAKSAGSRTAAERMILRAIAPRRFQGAFDWVRELDREHAVFAAASASWRATAVGDEALQDLTIQRAFARAEVGRLVRDRVNRTRQVLRYRSSDAIKLTIETNDRAGKTPAKRGPKLSLDPPVVIPGSHMMWKINAGFGRSSHGHYRFGLRSSCPKTAGKARAASRAKKPLTKGSKSGPDHFAGDKLDEELIRPDGTMTDFRRPRFRRSLFYVKKNFLREILDAGANISR